MRKLWISNRLEFLWTGSADWKKWSTGGHSAQLQMCMENCHWTQSQAGNNWQRNIKRTLCVVMIVLVAKMRRDAEFLVRIRWLRRRTLTDEMLCTLSTTKLDLHRKEKKATRKRAHIAACNRLRKLKKKAMWCKMSGVIPSFLLGCMPR